MGLFDGGITYRNYYVEGRGSECMECNEYSGVPSLRSGRGTVTGSVRN